MTGSDNFTNLPQFIIFLT